MAADEAFAITGAGASLRLTGSIDLATVPMLTQQLDRLVAPGATVLLDLTGVTFMDSSGIGAIIGAARAAGPGGCIVLHGGPNQVRNLFELTKIGRMAGIHVVDCDRR